MQVNRETVKTCAQEKNHCRRVTIALDRSSLAHASVTLSHLQQDQVDLSFWSQSDGSCILAVVIEVPEVQTQISINVAQLLTQNLQGWSPS